MKAMERIGIIWAIARKDIVEALKSRVVLSVILGVVVLVGSSQIGVLLQKMSDTHLVYIFDTTGYDLAYSPNIPPTLKLIAVTSDEELIQALVNNPGTSVGLKLTAEDDLHPLTANASYAHWADKNEVGATIDIVEPFLLSESGSAAALKLNAAPVYPENTTNRLVNSMSLTLIIVLFAFCGSLVPVLMIEEKRRKTLDVLLISPASVGEIIGGKALAGMFYGLMASCVTTVLLNRYVLHWEIAVLVSFAGTTLAVMTGLLLGALINSYHSINIYSAGVLLLLFLPLLPELLGLDIAGGFAPLLRLFPIPALMTLTRMIYVDSVFPEQFLFNMGALIASAAGIGLTAIWLVARIDA